MKNKPTAIKMKSKFIEKKRKIHNLYKDWVKSGRVFRKLTGKWQYIYTSPKGKISCVRFLNYFHEGDNFWEIYSLEGGLFEDVERFRTKSEAERQIEKYLS